MKTHKLSIVGVGHVGSAVLEKAVSVGLFSTISLVDIKQEVAFGEALDISHSMSSSLNPNTIVYSGGFESVKDADIIIIAAGPSIKPGCSDRLTLAKENTAVINDVMSNIVKFNTQAVIIMISNPLDVTTYLAATKFNLKKGQVFGTGTTLETLRFKYIISNLLKVSAHDVYGYVLGEHGNSSFPAFSTLQVAGMDYDCIQDFFKVKINNKEVQENVIKTAYEVNNAKGWTNTGIAAGAIRIAKAIVLDEKAILPVSMPLDGEYGEKGVSLSLPCLIGKDGIEKRFTPTLNDTETKLLKHSASCIRSVIDKLPL